jgi:hypothetical protein
LFIGEELLAAGCLSPPIIRRLYATIEKFKDRVKCVKLIALLSSGAHELALYRPEIVARLTLRISMVFQVNQRRIKFGMSIAQWSFTSLRA